MLVVNANAPLVKLYRNQIGHESRETQSGIVAVRLVGGNRYPEPFRDFSNRDGIGARIAIEAGDLHLLREHRAGEGFAAQNSVVMIVGVGSAKRIDSLTIRWPGGTKQTMIDIAVGSLVTIFENPSEAPEGKPFVVEPYRRNVRPGPAASHRMTHQRHPSHLLALATPSPASKLRVFTTMATWCPACRFWQTQVKALATTFDESDLQIFGVPIDPKDTQAQLDAYIEKYHPAYELLPDLSSAEVAAIGKIGSERFGSDPLPKSVVTDRDGEVLLVTKGVPSVSVIRRLLGELSNNGNGR